MVGTHDLKKLTDICLTTGAKTVWVGDRRQLQAIEPGGAFAAAADRVGTALLSTIYRQQDAHAWAREVVQQVALGNTTDALTTLYERGHIAFLPTRASTREALIRQWATGKDAALTDTLILATTNEEKTALNHLAQDVRFHEGALATHRPVVSHDGSLFFVGDRIIFEENNRRIGVKNGSRGVIQYISPEGCMTVGLDNGGTAIFSTKEYQAFSLGYAATTHSAQGLTRRTTYVLIDDGIINREMFYVQISRQRHALNLFVNAHGEDESVALTRLVERVAKSSEAMLAADLPHVLAERERDMASHRHHEEEALSLQFIS